MRSQIRRKARAEWLALIPGSHEGYVSWERSEDIRKMVSENVPTSRHHGAPKHGDALLAGLIRCRRCGRKLTMRYTGARHHIPRYSCWRGQLDNGEPRCIAFGGLRVDDAIEQAVIPVLEPAAIAAAVEAEAQAASRRDQVRDALMRDFEAARYEADRTFRQYDAADPQNRLVAAELEARWNRALARVSEIEARIATHDAAMPQPASQSLKDFHNIATDFNAIWNDPHTDVRLKKRIVRTLIQEVIADIDGDASEIVLLIHWAGGVHTELVGTRIECLVPHHMRDQVTRNRAAFFASPEPLTMGAERALFGLKKDGSEFPVEIGIAPMRDSDGTKIIVSVADISVRRGIEQELLRSHNRIVVASEAAKLGFWNVNLDTRTLQWDDGMYRLYGQPRVPGVQPDAFWADSSSPEEVTQGRALMATAMATCGKYAHSRRIITPSGKERFLRTAAHVIGDANGVAREVVGMAIDVTDLKEAENRIAEERDNAQAANKAKSTFLAMMSHELRTPMHGVIGLNELLCETALDPDQRQLAQGVHESAELLLRLINDILDLSKLEAGRLQLESIRFGIPRLLEETLGLLATQAAGKGLELGWATTGSPAADVLGDPIRLRQIVLNLAANAIKFTARGSVQVIANFEHRSAGRSRIRFTVSDTGIGIDAEAKSRLFRPFEQVDNSMARRFGGSGLGLSICRNLVTVMGGEIGVEDNPGGGTIFWFQIDLPLAPAGAVMEIMSEQGPAIAGERTACILVAEDNASNLQLVLGTLKPLGYGIDVAENGRQAVELAAARAYDLILMDVNMPELDGIAATRLIRAAEGDLHVPIVAMTANVFAEDRENCLQAGMDDFLAKPCTPADMREVVKAWIGWSQGPGPAATPASTELVASAAQPAIDTRVLDKLRTTLGEEEFVTVLNLGLGQIPRWIDRFQRSDARTTGLADIVHPMIRFAVLFGALRVAELARRLVAASDGGDRKQIEGLTAELIEAWDAALMELTLVRTFEPQGQSLSV